MRLRQLEFGQGSPPAFLALLEGGQGGLLRMEPDLELGDLVAEDFASDGHSFTFGNSLHSRPSSRRPAAALPTRYMIRSPGATSRGAAGPGMPVVPSSFTATSFFTSNPSGLPWASSNSPHGWKRNGTPFLVHWSGRFFAHPGCIGPAGGRLSPRRSPNRGARSRLADRLDCGSGR